MNKLAVGLIFLVLIAIIVILLAIDLNKPQNYRVIEGTPSPIDKNYTAAIDIVKNDSYIAANYSKYGSFTADPVKLRYNQYRNVSDSFWEVQFATSNSSGPQVLYILVNLDSKKVTNISLKRVLF